MSLCRSVPFISRRANRLCTLRCVASDVKDVGRCIGPPFIIIFFATGFEKKRGRGC
ncbi:hypothetical protein IscW_ISCW008203 [Ixodes scapularis]|uniref:Uncharacterized protein n=1 Tax=Ixodes scapularis TaxID=6945 RepID=B7PSY0_IXOSC|nr:hypothetical protein IscW_ISCW008203 [Ixodes scapularis]|eukprot:XP_002403350.1 hypothetical protein IscW_ISCW008203 [Ixodes scapularis]